MNWIEMCQIIVNTLSGPNCHLHTFSHMKRTCITIYLFLLPLLFKNYKFILWTIGLPFWKLKCSWFITLYKHDQRQLYYLLIFSDPYLSFFWSDSRVSLRDASLSLNPLLKNGIQPRAITLSIPSHLSSADAAHLLWSVIESSEMSLSCPPS